MADFGVALPTYCWPGSETQNIDLQRLVEFSKDAERMGFTSIWHAERLAMASAMYNFCWYDPLIALSAIASSVKKAKIGTAILVLPFRNPAILAKQIATLDVLSGGRVRLGLGTGWSDKEFELVGVDKKESGKRTEESIRIMKALWSGKKSTFHGSFWNFTDVELEPRPIQRPNPPIILGAGLFSYSNPDRLSRVMKRVTELGDGWMAATSSSVEQVVKGVAMLRKFMKDSRKSDEKFIYMHHKFAFLLNDSNESLARDLVAKRFPIPFDQARKTHLICDQEEMKKRVRSYVQAGLTDFSIMPLSLDHDLLELFSREVIPDNQD